MRKILSLLIILMVGSIFAVTVYSTPGPHSLWSGDTLKTNTTLTSTGILYMANFAKLNVWVKSTAPLESSNYRIYYKSSSALADTFASPADTVGVVISTTIMRVSDTLWHYRSVDVTVPYLKIYLTSSATLNGNRTRIWLKAFLAK
jgi:hypothetical protein